MGELERTGHLEDTVVILIGDNGPPFERGKTTCYESGLRTPFLVCWPGVSRPVASKALVSTTDIAPTIYDAAGVQGPVAMHGRSLRPVLTGGTEGWRQYLAGEFHCHGARNFYPRRALRDQRYKLIHNLRAGKGKPATGIDADDAWRYRARNSLRRQARSRRIRTICRSPGVRILRPPVRPRRVRQPGRETGTAPRAGKADGGHDDLAQGNPGSFPRRRFYGTHGARGSARARRKK